MKTLSPLRILLCLVAGAAALLGVINWIASGGPEPQFFLNVLAPALALMIFFVVALDITMIAVFLADAKGQIAAGMRKSLKIELLLIAALAVTWGHYFYRVLYPEI